MNSDSAIHHPQPVVRDEPARARPWTFTWHVAIALLHPLMRLILRLKIEGRENLDKHNAQIIAVNHLSHVDPVITGYASGLETSFLAKEEVFKASSFLAWLMSTYHTYPVSRGAGDVGALRKCSGLLRENRSLVLFPEGTRSKPGTLQELRPGVAMLSIMNRVPIVPAFIYGVRRTLAPWIVDPDIIKYHKQAGNPGAAHDPLYRFRLSALWAPRVRVVFGKPIRPDGYVRSKEDYRRLTGKLREAMTAMEREAQEAGKSIADARRRTPTQPEVGESGVRRDLTARPNKNDSR